MMNNKSTIYAFLAVIIGYSLMTYIPSTMSPSVQYSVRSNENNDSFLTTPPEGDMLGSETKTATQAAEEAANLAREQSEGNMQFIYITIDLGIALLVYYIARKRFV